MEYIPPPPASVGPVSSPAEPRSLTPGNKNVAATPSAFILETHSANQRRTDRLDRKGMKAKKDGWAEEM